MLIPAVHMPAWMHESVDLWRPLITCSWTVQEHANVLELCVRCTEHSTPSTPLTNKYIRYRHDDRQGDCRGHCQSHSIIHSNITYVIKRSTLHFLQLMHACMQLFMQVCVCWFLLHNVSICLRNQFTGAKSSSLTWNEMSFIDLIWIWMYYIYIYWKNRKRQDSLSTVMTHYYAPKMLIVITSSNFYSQSPCGCLIRPLPGWSRHKKLKWECMLVLCVRECVSSPGSAWHSCCCSSHWQLALREQLLQLASLKHSCSSLRLHLDDSLTDFKTHMERKRHQCG